MTVHMIRLFVEPPKGEAETAVDNWVSNHHEWTNDPDEHRLVETTNGLDDSGTTYVRGDYRFTQEDEQTELLDDLEARLQSLQGGLWYRIGYHVCDHDESDRSGCSWEQTRENGTVPSDIPVLE